MNSHFGNLYLALVKISFALQFYSPLGFFITNKKLCKFLFSINFLGLSDKKRKPPTKFKKRGALAGSQVLEGTPKEGVTFFRGVAIFT